MTNVGKSWAKAAFFVMLTVALLVFVGAVTGDQNSNRTAAELFAVLPDGSTGPEGLTVGPDGNIFVATFGFNQNGAVSGLGQVFEFNPEGRLLRHISVAGSSAHL